MIFKIFPKQLDDYNRHYDIAEDIYDKPLTDYYILMEKYDIEGYEKPIRGMSCVFTSDTVVALLISNVPISILHHGFFIKHIRFRLMEV